MHSKTVTLPLFQYSKMLACECHLLLWCLSAMLITDNVLQVQVQSKKHQLIVTFQKQITFDLISVALSSCLVSRENHLQCTVYITASD